MHLTKATAREEAVLRCVVALDFDTLTQIAPGSRVTAAELRKIVTDYGRRLVVPAASIEERNAGV